MIKNYKKIWELRNELLKLGLPVVRPASEHDTRKTASDLEPMNLYIYPSNFDPFEGTRVRGDNATK